MARRGGGKSGGSRGGSRGRGRASGKRSSGGSSSSSSRGGSSSGGSRGQGGKRGTSSGGKTRSGGFRARSGPKPGKTGGSNPLGGQKVGLSRSGNLFASGGAKNPRGVGGPRSRHLNRDAVLGSPKVRQRPQKAGPFVAKQVARKPRPLERRIPTNVAQQRLSDTYGVTTYNIDGTVATIPTATLPDGAPYNPNVDYEFDGTGGYTVVPKKEGYQ